MLRLRGRQNTEIYACLVLVVLAQLLVGGLVQELVELGLVADLELHEPSGLEGGLVHQGGVTVQLLQWCKLKEQIVSASCPTKQSFFHRIIGTYRVDLKNFTGNG